MKTLKNENFTYNAVQVQQDFKNAFEELRNGAKELFPLPLNNQNGQVEEHQDDSNRQTFEHFGDNIQSFDSNNQDRQQTEEHQHHLNIQTARDYINAYLADVIANQQQQAKWTNLNSQIDDMFYDYEQIQDDDKKCIITEKIIKVMEKLGENRLQELRDNPDEIKNISLLEKIGHYINEVIRAATFGLAGYEFSDKEAKEALNNSFNTNYDDENKSLFGLIDNNTRFAQVVQKERLIREEAAAMSQL